MPTGYEKISAIKAKLRTKMTVKQLASVMNCGPRTIFRHLDVITKENCGLRKFREGGETYYIIQTEGESNFNQGIVKQLEKVKKSLSATEASDIKSIKLLDKVISVMQTTNPEDFKPEAITTDPDYILDYGPFSDNKLQDSMVNKILKAIHDGFKIRIHYRHSSQGNDADVLELSPVKVIMRVDTLYLVAADHEFESTQIFKNYVFDRISNLVVTNTPSPNYQFDAKIHYKYAFGKYTDIKTRPEDISLLIKSKWLQTQFERSHFTPEATKRMDKDGNMIVDLKLRITPDFVTWLVGVSEDIRILKPASLKDAVRETLTKALAELDA